MPVHVMVQVISVFDKVALCDIHMLHMSFEINTTYYIAILVT